MYGGMDRESVPALKKADDDLIRGVTGAFGSREAASRAFSERGFTLYRGGDAAEAMRRFNQAWLLDPKNPDAFHGFGSVLHDREQMCEAQEMMERARALGLDHAGFLADLGRVSALCGVLLQRSGSATAPARFEASEQAYTAALSAATDTSRAYVYASHASALYWRGRYSEAWDLVAAAEAEGAAMPDALLRMLTQKMPRPATR